MVISEAVEALCNALAPDWANETLPTNTLCTTVLQRAIHCSPDNGSECTPTATRQRKFV